MFFLDEAMMNRVAQVIKTVFSSANYEEAELWLSEDEYERVDGRLVAEDAF